MSDLRAILRIGGVPEHYNLPWHLYLQSPAAGEAPVSLEWTDMPGGTGQMMGMLADGELDLAVTLTEGALAAIAGGNPSAILRTFVASPLRWAIHVSGGSDIYTDDELAGRRFAISRYGSGSHLMAHVLADERGFHIDDEHLIPVGGLDGARQAIGDGSAEVFLWDRSMTSPLVDSGEFRRVGLTATPWPAFVVVARRVVAGTHADAIATVLDAVAASARELTANPARVEMVASLYELDAAEVAAWFDETEWDCAEPTDPAMVTAVQSRLASIGLIAQERPVTDYLA